MEGAEVGRDAVEQPDRDRARVAKVREGFANRGLVTVTSPPEGFRAFIRKELDKCGTLMKEIGLKPE